MATLIDTIQPQIAYLEGVLPMALEGGTEEDFVKLYLTGLETRLTAHLEAYRSYGPWWPALKSLLLTQGIMKFGIENDVTVKAIYTMPRPALTIIAAHLYSDMRFDQGLVFSAQHLLDVNETADDTEPYSWESYDEEIERRISAKTRKA